MEKLYIGQQVRVRWKHYSAVAYVSRINAKTISVILAEDYEEFKEGYRVSIPASKIHSIEIPTGNGIVAWTQSDFINYVASQVAVARAVGETDFFDVRRYRWAYRPNVALTMLDPPEDVLDRVHNEKQLLRDISRHEREWYRRPTHVGLPILIHKPPAAFDVRTRWYLVMLAVMNHQQTIPAVVGTALP